MSGDDILLDVNDDLQILNGDFSIGDSLTQEIGSIIRLNQAELKSDPILGPNLIRLINRKVSNDELETIIKINLARDGKDYNRVKEYLNINRKVNG